MRAACYARSSRARLERLVGGGLGDVMVYVTSLQAAKSLLVIGGTRPKKSVWLVVSQVRP